MAGHSKFKNIMHRKGAQDKKRAKEFSRLVKEISVSVKSGSSDPELNVRLRSAIRTAKALNMPKDNIQRAIKKGEGNDSDSHFEEVRYEGYGPSGTAIIVEAVTNNKNRTASEIRSIFSKYGGNLGESGSVSYNFNRVGSITLNKSIASEEELFEFLFNNDSLDLETSGEEYIIYCKAKDLHLLNDKISKKFGSPILTQLTWRSENNNNVGKDNAEDLFKLLNTLEENEDVQNICSNFEVSEEIINEYT